MLLGRPAILAFILCRLGRNLRLATRVVFFPVPPFFLASPRRDNLCPESADLLQMAHFLSIVFIIVKIKII